MHIARRIGHQNELVSVASIRRQCHSTCFRPGPLPLATDSCSAFRYYESWEGIALLAREQKDIRVAGHGRRRADKWRRISLDAPAPEQALSLRHLLHAVLLVQQQRHVVLGLPYLRTEEKAEFTSRQEETRARVNRRAPARARHVQL